MGVQEGYREGTGWRVEVYLQGGREGGREGERERWNKFKATHAITETPVQEIHGWFFKPFPMDFTKHNSKH